MSVGAANVETRPVAHGLNHAHVVTAVEVLWKFFMLKYNNEKYRNLISYYNLIFSKSTISGKIKLATSDKILIESNKFVAK